MVLLILALFFTFIAVIPRLAILVSIVYIYINTEDIKYNIILHMLYNSTLIFI